MRKQQAVLRDTAQAERVRLAIRWGVHPDDISERRVLESATERLLRAGEDVIAWLK